MKKMYVHSARGEDQKCTDLAVAVLAGGESRRFGADKALVRVCADGPTLLERVVQAGFDVSSNVFVIGHSRYERLSIDAPIIPDHQPGHGPLAAIRSALLHSKAVRVLVLACDAPCLSSPLLQWMAKKSFDADILLVRTPDGRRQPMPAVYRRSLAETIEQELAQGRHAISSILDRASIEQIPDSTLRALDPDLGSFQSLNLPEQLDAIRRCVVCN